MKTKSKLKNKSGETLIEVLVGLLIIVLVMIMLPSAIILAARFNKQAEDKDISTMMDRTKPTIAGAEITVSYDFNGSNKSFSFPIIAYGSEDEEYCFYDYE